MHILHLYVTHKQYDVEKMFIIIIATLNTISIIFTQTVTICMEVFLLTKKPVVLWSGMQDCPKEPL